jgi:hypothetical protein
MQDCLGLLGWNGIAKTVGITSRGIYGLAGESIHLGPLSAVICSVFCQPSAPWWPAVVNKDGQTGTGAALSSADGMPPPESVSEVVRQPAMPKKRRTGGLKVCLSQS